MSGLDDLQADLDQLADDLDRRCALMRERIENTTDSYLHGVVAGTEDIAAELHHLLTDRDLDVPPLTSEIIAWLEADPALHIAERWSRFSGCWVAIDGDWQELLTEHGDRRQYGYRLATREPATERVRLDQLPGRTLPGETTPVNHFKWVYGDQRFEWCAVGTAWLPLDIAPDGTVAVLKDGSK